MRALPVIRLSSREALKARGVLQFQKTMKNNTIIIQAIAESERMCACVGVPLDSAAIRAALRKEGFEFTEEDRLFSSKSGEMWGGEFFSPDWMIASQSE